MAKLYTSLDEILSFRPCLQGWRDILKGQGKTEADDVQFPVSQALESNSISDICWLLGRKNEFERLVEFAKLCADSVAHLNNRYSERAAAHAVAVAYDAASAADDAYDAYVAAAYAAYNAAADDVAAAVAAAQKEKNKEFMRQVLDDNEGEF
jgi:hypothetical protein